MRCSLQLPGAETHPVYQRSPVQLHLHQVWPHREILCHRKCRRAGQPLGCWGAGVCSLLLQVGPPHPPPPPPHWRGLFPTQVLQILYIVTCRLDWPVRTLSFSHDGKMLASASEDHFIDIAEVETGQWDEDQIFFFLDNCDRRRLFKNPDWVSMATLFLERRTKSLCSRGSEWSSTNTFCIWVYIFRCTSLLLNYSIHFDSIWTL